VPALSEVPFSMDGIEAAIPPDVPPVAARATTLFFLDVVRYADDAVTASIMDPTDPDYSEPTVDEIHAMRSGVIAAATVIVEQFIKRGILNHEQWVAYMRELLAKDAE
jgi:hypothetical protein